MKINDGGSAFPLTIGVENDELVIRIGVGTLAYCFEISDDNNPYDEEINDFRRAYRVTDKHKFATGVANALTIEEEDGSTPLTKILDEAYIVAVEDCMGAEEDGRILTEDMMQYKADEREESK